MSAPGKHALMDWCENTIRADFAEKVAREIETSVSPCPRAPRCSDSFCWTCHDNIVAQGTAAMVRRVGGVT